MSLCNVSWFHDVHYCCVLFSTEKKSDLQKALGVILEMLDFACWRGNLDVWKRLKAIIQKLQLQYVSSV